MKRVSTILLSGLLFAACGDDKPNYGPELQPTPAQMSAVSAAESSTIGLSNSQTNTDAASTNALNFIGNTMTLLQAGLNATTAMPLLPPRVTCGQVRTDGTGVDFPNCTDGTFTINGSITWGGGRVTVALKMTGNASGVNFAYDLNGYLQADAATIKGDVTAAVSATYNGQSASLSIHAMIDVTYANGCINGGTYQVIAHGEGQGASAYNGAVRITWSDCHVFTVAIAKG
jgi:hypothetical protein